MAHARGESSGSPPAASRATSQLTNDAASQPTPYAVSTMTCVGTLACRVELSALFHAVPLHQRPPLGLLANARLQSGDVVRGALRARPGGTLTPEQLQQRLRSSVVVRTSAAKWAQAYGEMHIREVCPKSGEVLARVEARRHGKRHGGQDHGAKGRDDAAQGGTSIVKDVADGPHVSRLSQKNFDNQVTVVMHLCETDVDSPGDGDLWYTINAKVFRNGSVQMTGVRRVRHGQLILHALARTLQQVGAATFPEQSTGVRPTSVCVDEFRVCMMKAHFKLGLPVNRGALYRRVKERFHDLVACTYEPCVYAGVKMRMLHPQVRTRLTAVVFQSGCVIVTGATSEEHICHAYDVVCERILPAVRAEVIAIKAQGGRARPSDDGHKAAHRQPVQHDA